VSSTLVIHPGALGDVLLAIPALRALGRAAPDAELVLAAQPRIGELLRDLAVVDRTLRFERLALDALFVGDGLPDPTGELGRAGRVVCWFGARDAGFVRRLLALAPGAVIAPAASAERPVWEHLLATVTLDAASRREWEIGPGAPLAETSAAGASAVDAVDRDAVLRAPVVVPAPLLVEGRRALGASGWDGERSLVLVHPGASGPSKRWAVEGFASVIRTLSLIERATVVVHEGPSDAGPVGELLARVPAAVRLDNPSLPCLAGALAHATVCLGNDSGVTHLAASVGAPTIALCTERTLAWRPWPLSADVVVVSTASLDAAHVAEVTHVVERRLV
jgi:glycosyl transferase family 9 (putative heptosyltransferase)